MEGTVNPNKVTFEDWFNKYRETRVETGDTFTDALELYLYKDMLCEAWEGGYSAGFDDAEHANSIFKEAIASEIREDQERDK